MWTVISLVLAAWVFGWWGTQVDVRTGLTVVFAWGGLSLVYLQVLWRDLEARRRAAGRAKSEMDWATARILSLEADALVDGRRVRSLEARIESLEETISLLVTNGSGPWGAR